MLLGTETTASEELGTLHGLGTLNQVPASNELCRLREDTRTECHGGVTTVRSEMEGAEEMTEPPPHPRRDQGTEEGGPCSTWEPGFSAGRGMALGAAGVRRPRGTNLPCRGPLGRSPEDSAGTRLPCGSAGRG